MVSNNKIAIASQGAFDVQFNKAIKSGVDKGEFTQPKGKFHLPTLSFSLAAFGILSSSRISISPVILVSLLIIHIVAIGV